MIENTNRKNVYEGNGLNDLWPFTFEISTTDGSDIAVYLTDDKGQTGDRLTSGYSVDVINKRVRYPDPVGTILPPGWKITLARETPLTQTTSMTTQRFDPKSMEVAADKLTMIVQELAEEVSRSLKGDIAVTDVKYVLPMPESGRFLGWDFEAKKIINYYLPNGPVELQLKYDTNVRWYGAKGDGVADDTAAIKKALEAVANLGGGNLYFPPGVYLISDTLNLVDNVSLISQNRGDSTIKLADNANCTMIRVNEKANVFISNITLDGNNVNQEYPTSEYYGIDAFNSVGLTVFNCVIKNICAEGIHFDGPETKDAKCMFNTITDCFWSGICTDAPNVTIIGNTVRRCRANFITLNYPGCICIGNEVFETIPETEEWACGINLGHITPSLSSDKTIVLGNIVHDLPNTGIQVGNSQSVVVAKNMVYNITQGFGISVVAESKDVVVIGNHVFDIAGNPEAHKGYGIYCSHAWHAFIESNIVADVDAHGICLWDCVRAEVSRNKIRNVGKVDGNYIYVTGDLPGCPYTTIRGNECWDDQTEKTANYGIFINDSPDVTIDGNRVDFFKLTGVMVMDCSNIEITNNKIAHSGGIGEGHGIWLTNSIDPIIAHNRINDIAQGRGIYLQNNSHRAIIAGNKIMDIRQNKVSTLGDGIIISGLEGCVIRGNTVKDTDRFGIGIYNSDRNICAENIVMNVGKAVSASAISFSGTKNLVMGNITFDDQETKTTLYGVKNDGSVKDIVLGNIACNEDHLTKGVLLNDNLTGFNRFEDDVKLFGQVALNGANNVTITHNLGFNTYKVMITRISVVGTPGHIKLTKYNNAFTVSSSESTDTGLIEWHILT